MMYNAKVAIFAARGRVKAWAEHGYPCHVPGDEKRMSLFAPMVLCVDSLEEQMKLLNNMKEDMALSREGVESLQFFD